MLVLREAWQCLAEGDVGECALPDGGGAGGGPGSAARAPSASAPTPPSVSVKGEWATFDVVGVPLGEGNAGDDADGPTAAYSTARTRQAWVLPAEGPGEGGGAYWLPGGEAGGPAVLEVAMLSPVSRGPDADTSEGMAPPPGRALLVAVTWWPRDGTAVGVAREYDARGGLVEARCRSAVRADVAGGSM